MKKRGMRILAAACAFALAAGQLCGSGVFGEYPGVVQAEERSATVNATTLNVRSAPGTSNSIVKKLSYGTAVTVTGETTVSGVTWYQIRFVSGSETLTGYVSAQYIKFPVTYTQDGSFESYLNQQGFPESYKDALRTMHTEHPSWVFQAEHTGLDWDEVITNESRVGSNLVSSDSISSWKSTEYGAYDWNTGKWTGFDGSSWVAASKEIVCYYMDPRNFLNDTYVFQFLLHTYDSSSQTESGLASMLEGTFLDAEAVSSGSTGSSSTGSSAGSSSSGSSTGSSSSGSTGTLNAGQTGGPGAVSSGSSTGSTGTTSSVSSEGPGATSGSSTGSAGTTYSGNSEGPGATAASQTESSTTSSTTSSTAGSSGSLTQTDAVSLEGPGASVSSVGGVGIYAAVAAETAAAAAETGMEIAALTAGPGAEPGAGTDAGTAETGAGIDAGAAETAAEAETEGTGLAQTEASDTEENLRAAATPTVEYGPGMDSSAITGDTTGQSETSPVPTTGQTYAQIILSAGSETGVNPYVLAAMILQEQGKGTSGSISGKTSGYEGYYNFFNIGAYATDSMSAIVRGLWYASQSGSYGRPWNSIEKSITGGASYYAETYVKVGQDTFYLKKFNVQGTNLYKHQYMTNVEGAAGEGAKLANAYTSEIKNQALTFKIPVYNNMPETACARPTVTGSPNNKLKSLEAEGYTLTPTFSMDTESYDIIVNPSVTEISVKASAIDSAATVSGTGVVSLQSGTNTVSVEVKAENGSVRTYKLNIVRQSDAPAVSVDTSGSQDSGSTDTGSGTSAGQTGGPGSTQSTTGTTGSSENYGPGYV